MEASLVAYDFRELHKKSELEIVKFGYVNGCPKKPVTQIWSLEILRVKAFASWTIQREVFKYDVEISHAWKQQCDI
jgi:hypothetical protein